LGLIGSTKPHHISPYPFHNLSLEIRFHNISLEKRDDSFGFIGSKKSHQISPSPFHNLSLEKRDEGIQKDKWCSPITILLCETSTPSLFFISFLTDSFTNEKLGPSFLS
jgi:hypothetical protein